MKYQNKTIEHIFWNMGCNARIAVKIANGEKEGRDIDQLKRFISFVMEDAQLLELENALGDDYSLVNATLFGIKCLSLYRKNHQGKED